MWECIMKATLCIREMYELARLTWSVFVEVAR